MEKKKSFLYKAYFIPHLTVVIGKKKKKKKKKIL